MPKSKAMKDPGGYLREEDCIKIINTPDNERDKLILTTLYETGRRVSEVVGPLGIRPIDLDTESSTIAFTVLKKKKDPQGDRPRNRKYVPNHLIIALEGYLNRQNIGKEQPIFPMTRQMVFFIIRKWADKAGVTTISGKKVHPHHFRHSFVTKRVLQGLKWEDALNLKEYMEHSSTAVTESYVHIDPTRAKKLFDNPE